MVEIDRSKSRDELYELAREQAEMIEQYEEVVSTSSLRMRTILTNLPISLVIVNDMAVIEAVNNKMLELFGYETGEVTNKPLAILFEEGNILEKSNQKEFQALRKDGQSFPCETSFTEVSMGKQSKTFVHIKDLTHEYELKEMRRTFLKMVSHDMRNPLTSIQGFLDLLEEGSYGELSSKARNACHRTRATTKRLIELVNQLLDSESLEKAD